MHFTSRFGFKLVFKKCCEWPCQGSYHPSTYSLAGSLSEKKQCSCDNVLDCGHWMIPILELSWIPMNCQQYKAQGCHSGLFHMIQLLSSTTAYHEQQDYRKSEPPHYYNASVDKRMNQVAFLQILVPGSETLPTSANICQHLLTQPASLIQAVACSSGRYPPDMCISDAVRRSKDGQARFPKFCDAAMFLLFCYHYHVISCLWYPVIRSVQSLPESPGAPNPNFHK